MAESASKRNIPIKMGDFSVIDTEFSSIRERFDQEMRKMEDEMAKFRSDLMNREANYFESSTSSTTKKITTTSSSGSSSTTSNNQSITNNSSSSALSPLRTQIPKQNYISDLNSPLIQDEGDSKVLKLRFDVSQYAPEEIVVKTVDQKLLVHAKHEEKSDTKSVYREYNREFLLPKGVNPEQIRSSLSKDGVLTVDAPLPTPALTAGEKLIPIAH
ncbi:heat shock protein beta-1 isoform X2 [Contarinia nasturtii]|uniref:heat shock protein beta-1 isoform X2 n=1 Tax=Contarinia nasturtii TaxID=265458 RepID=UPI0012D3EA0B|nr:heat shock protein beta-1 isoform X2 [Contarinia nasturtii]